MRGFHFPVCNIPIQQLQFFAYRSAHDKGRSEDYWARQFCLTLHKYYAVLGNCPQTRNYEMNKIIKQYQALGHQKLAKIAASTFSWEQMQLTCPWKGSNKGK